MIADSLDRSVAATVPRDVVVVSGPEAEAYLHGQISADVESLGVGESALSFLLEPRGRVEVLFGLCRSALEAFVLDTEPGFGEPLAASLERFKLRTRADFTWHQWSMHALRSAAAVRPSPGDVAASDDPLPHQSVGQRVARAARWPLAAGVDVLMPDEGNLPDAFSQAESISADEFDALRIAYGLPAMGAGVLIGDIPNETGIVERAASFTKGCYRGQELVERIDSRSGGRRILRRVRSASPLEADEQLLDAEGTSVATVRCTATVGDTVVGYALARRDAADEAHTASGKPVLLAAI
ncbi:YgfZ/GcvT domain-containing protein [Candidatus Poriferisodalis sp.]|uniref:YgfZ/GcvT domain-containing protein n=1 Tax=Candidatus Poriferisodalis sp. TaxID=3101277 RepID=UPI003B017B82